MFDTFTGKYWEVFFFFIKIQTDETINHIGGEICSHFTIYRYASSD